MRENTFNQAIIAIYNSSFLFEIVNEAIQELKEKSVSTE